MIDFQAPRHFTILVFNAIAVIALTVTGCQPEKQVGPPEKVGGNNHDQQ